MHDLQSLDCKPLFINDLLSISPVLFPYYIPLFGKESAGRSGMLVNSNCSVKPWARPLAGLSSIPTDRSFQGLAEQVTGGQISRGSTLSPGPSSGMASCPCCGSEISSSVHPAALPLSA